MSESLNGGSSNKRERSASLSSHRVVDTADALSSAFKCCGCAVSGNSLSLMCSAFLFALITVVQYVYAVKAKSKALQADCVSMAVDSLAFLGNLFAECMPNTDPDRKRRVQLAMSGISHFLLLGFTIYFIFDAVGGLQGGDDDDVDGKVVLIFALGGLLFDAVSLVVYWCFGERSGKEEKDPGELEDPIQDADDLEGIPQEDALTCGINTNMCAALLHVLSDLCRSTTTLIESIIILKVPTISSSVADAVSTLIICSLIIVGAVSAVIVWMREVYVYITSPKMVADGYGRLG